MPIFPPYFGLVLFSLFPSLHHTPRFGDWLVTIIPTIVWTFEFCDIMPGLVLNKSLLKNKERFEEMQCFGADTCVRNNTTVITIT